MNQLPGNIWMISPMLLSGIVGIELLVSSFVSHIRISSEAEQKKREKKENSGVQGKAVVALKKETEEKPESLLHLLVGVTLFISALLVLAIVWWGNVDMTLFYLMDEIPIYFHVDALGRLFVTVTSIIWPAVGVYSFVYMKHEGEEKRFFGFFLLVYAVVLSLEFAGNLVTFYFFYEMMTLASMPLVLHNETKEAIMAALKYLFYSMCGAYCALFGIYFLNRYCYTLRFVAGGTLNMTLVSENSLVLQIAVLLLIIGFGTKAGMLPFHSWLTAAHPVAPAPASAALSSIIVKGGVLAVIRSIYYVVGPEFLRGTWIQTVWMILTLLTVFMGSLLAYREKVFKKRLAYSTVSQVSYILFGLATLHPTAMTGSLLHFVYHACIKCALFLTAGIFIFRTGKTRAEEYTGIGKQMPITLWCYTFASLALIGIPPMSGFISKWYLAQGALQADIGIFRILGPVVLLLSALLTAGYLLPITLKGFFPGKGFPEAAQKEPIDRMAAALLVLAVLAVLLGILPNPLIGYAGEIAASVY